MYYRLCDGIALRRWAGLGYGYLVRGKDDVTPLSPALGETLRRFDGEHDVDTNALVMLLVMQKFIEPCEKGEKPSAWSAFREIDNRCFPMMNLMITGKCNFNCLHCFNAADNAALNTQWRYEDILRLLDEARDCGVNSFTITGGEPMVHPRFLDILREIYLRDMSVFELNTNGFLITREILEEMKAIGAMPAVKISFDGIGAHDWIRRFPGAERRALEAMRLCVENGFEVRANTQVHRGNLHTLRETLTLLDGIGLQETRLIRTSEAPRWSENAPDACLPFEEYYERMLELAKWYTESGMRMNLRIWQYIDLYPGQKSYSIRPVKFPKGAWREDAPCCPVTCRMCAVTSSGEVMPCMQMSGYFMKYGIHFGNARETPLKELLSGGQNVNIAQMTVGELRAAGTKCGACPYFQYCGGGCRALGPLFAGERADFAREDVTKCLFYENGWYRKVTEALPYWKNLSEISL